MPLCVLSGTAVNAGLCLHGLVLCKQQAAVIAPLLKSLFFFIVAKRELGTDSHLTVQMCSASLLSFIEA